MRREWRGLTSHSAFLHVFVHHALSQVVDSEYIGWLVVLSLTAL